MSQTKRNTSVESTGDIRIARINTDKTRKTNGSYTEYQVYFEMSGTPLQAWRDIFGREWKDLMSTSGSKAGSQAADIDGRFLVVHCPLEEVAAIHLPVLKKAVAATNTAYKRYVQEHATEQKHRNDVWKQERKAVEDMAELLHF
jgi:hypothetical protein